MRAITIFSSMMIKLKPMKEGLTLGHKIGHWKMLEILAKEGLKMDFTTKFAKKTQKDKNRLQKTFSMENLFGK